MSAVFRSFVRGGFAALLAALTLVSAESFAAGAAQTSSKFEGPKANRGTVAFMHEGKDRVLTLSQDFVTPDTPDPHWQIVDSDGNVITLERLAIKEGKENRSITLPAYVRDVAKVVIWCAFAEANLGEAAFARPQK